MLFKNLFASVMGCLGLEKQRTQPAPSADTDGSLLIDLKVIDSPRIRLRDGRLLAYRERGVPKDNCNYKVIIVHGFGSSKDMQFVASQELLDDLKIYLLSFDRAGYGESDPNPKRSLESEASDIEELADKLQLGSKFYVIGVSLGCYPIWSCLRCMPNRLSGIALVVPYVNYNWPSLPDDLARDDYRKHLSWLLLFVERYTPRFLLRWLIQLLFPILTSLDCNPAFLSDKDLELKKNAPDQQLSSQNMLSNKGAFDSICRDLIVAFSEWDFDPVSLCDPYPQKESTVHVWQGHEDKIVPFQLQRHISGKLPWIQYHEVLDGGHWLFCDGAVCEAILRSLLLGEDTPMYRPELVR